MPYTEEPCIEHRECCGHMQSRLVGFGKRGGSNILSRNIVLSRLTRFFKGFCRAFNKSHPEEWTLCWWRHPTTFSVLVRFWSTNPNLVSLEYSQTAEKMVPPCMARQDLVCMFYDIILFWLNRNVIWGWVRFRFCVQFARHGSSASENEQVTEQIFRLRSWFTNFQEAQSGAALFRETYRWV